MEYYLLSIVEKLVMPPGIFLVLVLIAFKLVHKQRPAKQILLFLFFIMLILSLPATHYLFPDKSDSVPYLSQERIAQEKAEIIVVLAGGLTSNAWHGTDVGLWTLQRLRYAAYIQKQLKLPILVTGGKSQDNQNEAQLMQKVLLEEYAITSPIYTEQQSLSTAENAANSYIILAELKIKKAILITHASHMSRAIKIFSRYPVKFIAAPVGTTVYTQTFTINTFIPSVLALLRNTDALRELLGNIWYGISSYWQPDS